MAEYETAIVRLRSGGDQGRTVGLGALVGPMHVVTSAHVVNAALGRDLRQQEQPREADRVLVDFPLMTGAPVRSAKVVAWLPPPQTGVAADSGGDVAGLVFTEQAPRGAEPARLVTAEPEPGAKLRVFGYPQSPPRASGAWVELDLKGRVGGQMIQVESRGDQTVRVTPGYSGSPVWDRNGDVVGLLALASSSDGPERDAYLLPSVLVIDAWKEPFNYRPMSEKRPSAQRGERDQVEWLSDAPSDEDLLRRWPLARALATRLRRFCHDEPGTSFLVHIDGSWGMGKSTLLNLLRQELEQEQEQEQESQWLTVPFNAWRQSRVGAPWWALLAVLRHEVVRPHRVPVRVWLRLAESWARFRRASPPFVFAFFVLLLVAAAVFALLRPHKFTFAASVGLVQGTVALLAALGTLWAGALVAGRFLLWDSARGAKLFEQSNANPMQDIAEHFSWLAAKAKRPVVFFIDDLDRCADSYVIDLLDTVQTLVRDVVKDPAGGAKRTPASVSFVVAADGSWIRQSYEIKYTQFTQAVATPGRSLGYLFLDKLFQLRVPVPTIDPIKQQEYLRDILRGQEAPASTTASDTEEQAVRESLCRSSSEAEVVETLRNASPLVRGRVAPAAVEKLTTKAVAATTEHHLQRFANLLEANPRAMKRFVNDYSILRAVRTLESNPVSMDPLALWAIIETRWPGLADYLRARPETTVALAQGRGARSETVPADLRSLFDDPSVYELVNFEYGGPLTPELVSECCGAAPEKTDHEGAKA